MKLIRNPILPRPPKGDDAKDIERFCSDVLEVIKNLQEAAFDDLDCLDGSTTKLQYITTAGQSIPNAAYTKIQYDTLVEDNLGEFANYTFTSCRDGCFLVRASVLFASSAWIPGATANMYVYKNNAMYRAIDRFTHSATLTDMVYVGGTIFVPMNEGDTLDIRVYQSRGDATTLYPSGTVNYICIHQLGLS